MATIPPVFGSGADSTYSTLAIVIIVLCALAGLGLVLLISLVLVRRKRHQHHHTASVSSPDPVRLRRTLKERLSISRPPPEKPLHHDPEDLVFSSILQYPPQPILSNNNHSPPSSICAHDDPILLSLARERQDNLVGFYKSPDNDTVSRQEQAILQRLSTTSYPVW